MFGLSGEHILILAAVLLIFGPRKLPELGASVGKAFRNFKDGLNGPTNTPKLDPSKEITNQSHAATTEESKNIHS